MHQGLFITIEGSDGSGKETQFKLLAERLKAAGYDVSVYDFPQYHQESSYFVREYLNGAYGSAEALGPYTPSLFFALDRFSVSHKIKRDLTDGKIVLSNRYVGSNMAHQGAKFSSDEDKHMFFKWLEQLEFEMLGSPRADANIVLTVPAEVAQSLIDKKEKRDYTDSKRDIHEADLAHLKRAVETYQLLTSTYPETFLEIDCTKNNELLTITAVHNKIWERVEPMLERFRKKNPKHTDEGAAQTQPKDSSKQTEQIIKNYNERLSNLRTRIAQLSEPELKNYCLQLTEPVGVITRTPIPTDLFKLLHDKNLQPIKGESDKTVALLDRWPKNEADVLPLSVYPLSTLSFAELSKEISTWSYQEKSEALTASLRQEIGTHVSYHLEFVSSYRLFTQLNSIGIVSKQPITPFYGYDEGLSENAAEAIDACFEESFNTYQLLQQQGAQQDILESVCLKGHKLRWQNSLNLAELKKVYEILKGESFSEANEVSAALKEVLSEVHPLVAVTLLN